MFKQPDDWQFIKFFYLTLHFFIKRLIWTELDNLILESSCSHRILYLKNIYYQTQVISKPIQ